MTMYHKTRPLISLVSALTIAAFLAPIQASANSRFHVQNDGSENVLVNIFNGDDILCSAEAKHKTIHPGETQSMGCVGGGKHRCKIRVSIDKEQVCMNLNNACGDTTINIKNHAELKVPENSGNCSIQESE